MKAKSLLLAFTLPLLNLPLITNAQYQVNGNASNTGNGCFQLTPNTTAQVGSVWNTSQINLNSAFDFTFSVFLGCNDAGADGICFGLQPLSTSIGVAGNGMGLGGVAPSLGVYIDTYQNSLPDFDPAFDHISINSNGNVNHNNVATNLAGPVQASATSADIEDCVNHILRVTWDPVNQLYEVYFDGALRLSYLGDIITNVFGGSPNVYWGFTGATGGLSNQQGFCIVIASNFSASSICQGTPTQFTDLSLSGTPISNWTWNFGDGSPVLSGTDASIVQNPVHTYTLSGTYTAQLTITNSGFGTSTISHQVIVVAPPGVTTTGTTTICAGQTANLTGTVSGASNVPLTISSTGANNNVAIPDIGITTAWTGTGGNFATSTIPVTGLNPGFVFNSIQFNITHTFDGDLIGYLFNPCGNSIQLISSNGGAGDNFTNTTFANGATVGIGTGAAPFNGTFIPSGGNAAWNAFIAASQACGTANGNWQLRVGDKAATDVGTINNWTLNFTNPTTPTFVWSPASSLSNASSLNPIASPTITTTYSLTATNSFGCSAVSQVPVIVSPGFTLSVNSPTICMGDIATLVVNGADTYTWPGNVTQTGPNTADASPLVSASYTIVGTSAGCSASVVATVNVSTVIPITVNSPTICAGETAVLIASGADEYFWSAGIDQTGVNTAEITPNTTTTFTVDAFTASGCSGTQIATVFVNPLPSITVNSPSICAGQTAQLTANGADSYTWGGGVTSTGTNTAEISPTTTTTLSVIGNLVGCTSTVTATVVVNALPVITANSPSICFGNTATIVANGASSFSWSAGANPVSSNSAQASPTVTSTYTITGSNNGCIDSITTTVTVISLPTVTVISASNSICAGQITTLTANGASNYTWSLGATPTGTNTATVSPNTTTTFTVTGTVNGCSNTDVATIDVTALPILTVNSPSICDGQTANLIGNGANTYTWSNGVTSTGLNTGSVNPTTSTNYTLTGTTNGCSANTIAVVTVSTLPTVTVNSPTICTGQTANLTANGANTYTWSVGVNSTGINTATASPSSTTSYSVQGSNNGCNSTINFTVNVNALPVPTVSANIMNGCAPLCVQFTETSSAICSTLLYNFGDSNTGATSSPLHCYPNSGNYAVTVSCTDAIGCTGSVTLSGTINVNPVPNATFVANPTGVIQPGTTVTFAANSTSLSDLFFWNFGDVASGSSNFSTLSNTSHSFNETGNYCTKLMVVNTAGCADSTVVCFDVVGAPYVVIPNVFTPNGDGHNDLFTIDATNVKTLNCTIYDRWGIKMREWNELKDGWDGRTTSGNTVADGVYYYVLKAVGLNDSEIERSGFIQLTR